MLCIFGVCVCVFDGGASWVVVHCSVRLQAFGVVHFGIALILVLFASWVVVHCAGGLQVLVFYIFGIVLGVWFANFGCWKFG